MAGQPGIRHVYTAGAFKPEEVAGKRGIPSLDRFQEEASSTRLSMVFTIRAVRKQDFRYKAGQPSCRRGRRPFLAVERTRTSGKQRRASPADARNRGSIWSVSDSFPELAQAVTELAQPSRIDIVRAKRHLLAQISDGLPHPVEALIANVAHLLGAEPLGYPQMDLPARDSVKTMVTTEHPFPLRSAPI